MNLLGERAVLNVLFEGKARRLELIQELRLMASPEGETAVCCCGADRCL